MTKQRKNVGGQGKKRIKTIYMDYASATPVGENVYQDMKPFFLDHYGNPSALHKMGVQAHKAVESARKNIADCLHAHPDEIFFTSGGTESDNLAIEGVVRAWEQEGKKTKPHIITTTIEHSAVLETCRALELSGRAEVSYIGVTPDGIVSVDELKKALKPATILVSVMYANNEIGTIQPIHEIASVIRHHKKKLYDKKYQPHVPSYPYFHTDAMQAPLYLPLYVEKLGIDLLSFNGSKIYGPKGIGALFKKRGVKIARILAGGDQESGLRAGTENVPLIVGLDKALALAEKNRDKESKRLRTIQQYFFQKLEKSFPAIILNGSKTERLPNNINVSFPDFDSELLLLELDARNIYASAKSACKSHDPLASYVILEIRGKEEKEMPVEGTIRFSLGKSTTKKEIDTVISALQDIHKKYDRFK